MPTSRFERHSLVFKHPNQFSTLQSPRFIFQYPQHGARWGRHHAQIDAAARNRPTARGGSREDCQGHPRGDPRLGQAEQLGQKAKKNVSFGRARMGVAAYVLYTSVYRCRPYEGQGDNDACALDT